MKGPKRGRPLTEADAEVAAELEARAQAARPKRVDSDPVFLMLTQALRSDHVNVERSTFSLSDCERAARYLGWPSGVEEPSPQHQRRQLSFVRLQIGVGGRGLSCFHNSFRGCAGTLRKLDLSKNRLAADDVKALCRVLGQSGNATALEVLILSGNRTTGDVGLQAVLDLRAGQPQLQAVIVECCGITDVGAATVATFVRALPTPPDRQKFFVNLNRNLIGSRGLQMLQGSMPDFISVVALHQSIRARVSDGANGGEGAKGQPSVDYCRARLDKSWSNSLPSSNVRW
jgi:hypothetical protein